MDQPTSTDTHDDSPVTNSGSSRGWRVLRRVIALTLVLALLGLALTSQFRSEVETGTEARLPEAPSRQQAPPAATVEVPDPASEDEPAEPTPATVRPPLRPTPSLTSGDGTFNRDDFVGRWVLNDSIRRDVTINADGSATMDVDLDFVSSLFYGSEMTLTIYWQLTGDVITHTLLSGEPKKNVDKLVKDFGNKRSYRVISIDDEAMVLEDYNVDSPERHRWVKMPDPSDSQTRVDEAAR